VQVTVSVAPFSDCPVLCAEPRGLPRALLPPSVAGLGRKAVRASPPRPRLARGHGLPRMCRAQSCHVLCEIHTQVPHPRPTPHPRERERRERERESPAVGRVPRLHTGTSPQPHPTPQLVSLKRFFVTLTFFCVWVCKRIRELLAALALISYSDVRVVSTRNANGTREWKHAGAPTELKPTDRKGGDLFLFTHLTLKCRFLLRVGVHALIHHRHRSVCGAASRVRPWNLCPPPSPTSSYATSPPVFSFLCLRFGIWYLSNSLFIYLFCGGFSSFHTCHAHHSLRHTGRRGGGAPNGALLPRARRTGPIGPGRLRLVSTLPALHSHAACGLSRCCS